MIPGSWHKVFVIAGGCVMSLSLRVKRGKMPDFFEVMHAPNTGEKQPQNRHISIPHLLPKVAVASDSKVAKKVARRELRVTFIPGILT